MPRVGQYQSQFKDANLPSVGFNVQAPAEAFGLGSGSVPDAIQKGFDPLIKMAEEQKKKADQMAVYEADAKMSEFETSILYDPKNGAMNKKGKDAFDLQSQIVPQFDGRVKELEDGLGNAEQKAMFKKLQLERYGNIDRNLQKHIGTEIVRHDDAVTQNFIKNEKDAAVQNYRDMDRVKMSLARQEQALMDFADRHGLSDDEIQQKLTQMKSDTHTSVITRMIDTENDQAAEVYFNKIKSELGADDLKSVESVIEEGTTRGKTQRLVDGFMKAGFDEKRSIEEVKDKIKDPKLRDKAIERIRQEFNIKDSAEKARVEKLYLDAGNIVYEKRSLDAVPPSVMAQLSVAQKNGLKSLLDNLKSGGGSNSSFTVYQDLKTMASDPVGREKFLTEDISSYQDRLERPALKELLDLQLKMRNGESEADQVLTTFRSKKDIVESEFELAGGNLKNKKEVKKYFQFVENSLIEKQRDTGKKPTIEDFKVEAQKAMLQIVTDKGFIWDTEKSRYQLDTEDKIEEIEYESIPQQEIKDITDYLVKKLGTVPTEAKIMELYKKQVQRELGK